MDAHMAEYNSPYIALGKHLKYVREQSKQSLIEVSGAVEIDEKTLERIESGEERPAEDILLLLISHFGVQDQEAIQLWELANYDGEIPDQIKPESFGLQNSGKPVVMLVALDMRTIYSDGLDITCTQSGVTLNFTQTSGRQAQPSPVSRIGMSYDQAEKVLINLHKSLMKVRYLRDHRALPPQRSIDAPEDTPKNS
jgi:transcriptional regulator with XRE-family HTH domain